MTGIAFPLEEAQRRGLALPTTGGLSSLSPELSLTSDTTSPGLGLRSDGPLFLRYVVREVGRPIRLRGRGKLFQGEGEEGRFSSHSLIRKMVARAQQGPAIEDIHSESRRLYSFMLQRIITSMCSMAIEQAAEWMSPTATRFSSTELRRPVDAWRNARSHIGALVLGGSGEDGQERLHRVALSPDRTLEDLRKRGLDLRSDIEKRLTGGSPVRVMDLGCASGLALRELKLEYGRRVEVIGISLGEEPHFPLDLSLNRSFERLPSALKGEVDIAWSHYGLDYAVLPHLALSSALTCLKPGGTLKVFRGDVNPALYTASDETDLRTLAELYSIEFARLGNETLNTEWKEYFNRCRSYLVDNVVCGVALPKNAELEIQHCAAALWWYALERFETEVSVTYGAGPVLVGDFPSQDLRRWVTFERTSGR